MDTLARLAPVQALEITRINSDGMFAAPPPAAQPPKLAKTDVPQSASSEG